MMIRRRVSRLLRERLASAPAVVLLGPRQCGKTTLARGLSRTYFDLERERIVGSRALVILDEAQAWPSSVKPSEWTAAAR